MLVDSKSAESRLNSPLNLMNRLKSLSSPTRKNSMELFTGRSADNKQAGTEIRPFINPFRKVSKPEANSAEESKTSEKFEQPDEQPPLTLDNLLENSNSQIKLGLAHDKALDLLVNSVSVLASKLDDVSAGKLPQTILAASKVVESIRRERNEAIKNDKDKEIHYHFYVPEKKALSDFEVIDVT
jgi:hypothetical protein